MTTEKTGNLNLLSYTRSVTSTGYLNWIDLPEGRCIQLFVRIKETLSDGVKVNEYSVSSPECAIEILKEVEAHGQTAEIVGDFNRKGRRVREIVKSIY